MSNMENPIVSIIIPIYNSALFLRECLDSIKEQTIVDFEVLCVDDGSTDDSANICAEYERVDNRFHLIKKPNAGVSSARNRGLKDAKGKFVCFVDSDDIVAPNYLKNLLNVPQNNDSLAMCHYSRELSKLEDGACTYVAVPTKDFICKIYDESIAHPGIYTMLFDKSIVDMYGILFSVGCVRNEDTEFYIKYMTHIKSICLTDYNGYYYRDNPSSAVHKINMKSLSYIEADERITKTLIDAGLFDDNNLIVPASVQYFVYKTPKFKSRDVYDEVHNRYSVRPMMRKMLKHPRMSRKIVAVLYLVLGKSLFYKLLSLL